MKILCLFKRPVDHLLEQIGKGKQPSDTVYATYHLSKKFEILTSDSIYQKSAFLKLIQQPFTKIATIFTNVGFSIIPIIVLKKRIQETDIVYSTLDTVGLPILLLKYLKFTKKPIIYNTIGLETNLQIKKSNLARKFYSKLLNCAEVIISVASLDECRRLSRYLDIPFSKFAFCPFGVDSKYFSPQKIKEKEFILSIGADIRRDWKLLLESANSFNLPLEIICAKGMLEGYQISKNVEIVEDLPIEKVRDLMARAKVIILPLEQSSYFTGQTTFFRAMSMGKAVVITKIHPFRDYPGILDSVNCMLCRPGDAKELIEKTNILIANGPLRKVMGERARKLILAQYTVEKYAQRLTKIFKKFNIEQEIS